MKSGLLSLLILLFVAPSLKAQAVYKTPSGAKYHLASCGMVKNVSEQISIENARILGLEPCKICRPPISENSNAVGVNKAVGQNQTVQCKGLTKAGTRCKHMTKMANGYCFQHQR